MPNLRLSKVDMLADDPIEKLQARDNRIKGAMRKADPSKGLTEPQRGLAGIFASREKKKDKK